MQIFGDGVERGTKAAGGPAIGGGSLLAGRAASSPSRHAIIIHNDRLVGQRVERQLRNIGFSSVVHARTERRAAAAAEQHMPDVIVVGDMVEDQPGINAALRIRQRNPVPIILIPAEASRQDSPPALFGDIAAAVEEALDAPEQQTAEQRQPCEA